MVPEIGTELTNPRTGTRTVFTATAETTGGAAVEVEATYPPHGSPPPRHLHPSQDEHFTVLRGEVTVVRGEETATFRSGAEFSVPRGQPHQMWSDGPDGALVRWRTEPALRTGEMFCDLWESARDAEWAPSPMQQFEVVSRYAEEFRLC